MKDKYCLQSIESFQSINQSPNNKSSTKQTFSFSRSSRFQTIKPTCPTNTYGGSEISRKRSGASIGYGKKYDFTKSPEHTPQAGKYTISSIFDSNRQAKRGASIGSSRQNIKFNSYIDHLKINNPGIGRYTLNDEVMIRTSRAPAFSIGHRTKPSDLKLSIDPQNKNPSPADYENNPEMSKTLFGSQFKKTSYGFSNSKRFADANNKVPGPGNYQNPTNLSNIGKYLISNQKGGTNAKFDRMRRTTKFDEAMRASKKNPGPGAYRSISQFGQYDGNVYGKAN